MFGRKEKRPFIGENDPVYPIPGAQQTLENSRRTGYVQRSSSERNLQNNFFSAAARLRRYERRDPTLLRKVAEKQPRFGHVEDSPKGAFRFESPDVLAKSVTQDILAQ